MCARINCKIVLQWTWYVNNKVTYLINKTVPHVEKWSRDRNGWCIRVTLVRITKHLSSESWQDHAGFTRVNWFTRPFNSNTCRRWIKRLQFGSNSAVRAAGVGSTFLISDSEREIKCCVSWEVLYEDKLTSYHFDVLFAATGGRQQRITTLSLYLWPHDFGLAHPDTQLCQKVWTEVYFVKTTSDSTRKGS